MITANKWSILDIKITCGLSEALRAMGLKNLSNVVKEQDEYRESVIASEGVMPIKDRPMETQLRLEFAHKIDLIAYEVFEREISHQ